MKRLQCCRYGCRANNYVMRCVAVGASQCLCLQYTRCSSTCVGPKAQSSFDKCLPQAHLQNTHLTDLIHLIDFGMQFIVRLHQVQRLLFELFQTVKYDGTVFNCLIRNLPSPRILILLVTEIKQLKNVFVFFYLNKKSMFIICIKLIGRILNTTTKCMYTFTSVNQLFKGRITKAKRKTALQNR